MKGLSLIRAGAALVAASSSTVASAQALDAVAVELGYVTDVFAVAAGGLARDTRALGKADLILEAAGDPVGLPRTRLNLNVQYIHGGGLSETLVGDAQVASNIDAPSGLRLFEAYVGHTFGPSDRGELKIGLIDLNGDFDVQETGGLFLNSSHGIGAEFAQTGENGPSIFPTASGAVTLSWRGQAYAARLGVFDAVSGDPDHPARTILRAPGETGMLMVGELELSPRSFMTLKFGAWGYDGSHERLVGTRRESGNAGIYAIADGQVARWRGQSVDAWVRLGWANGAINPIDQYVGSGVAWGDEKGRFGLAIAHARLGEAALQVAREADEARDREEVALELTYRRQVNENVAIQPNLQLIHNPGWAPMVEDAWVAGVRFELFSR